MSQEMEKNLERNRDLNTDLVDQHDRLWDADLPIRNYRDFLRRQVALKKKKNPAYSMRAFATLIKMTPGGFSRLLSGKMGLTADRATEIAMHLKLNNKDRDQFITLVQYDRAKNQSIKSKLYDKLNEANPVFTDLKVDQFQAMANWLSLAILRYTGLQQSERTIHAIAKEFGRTQSEVAQVLERFQRLKLIKKQDDQWVRVDANEVHIEFPKESDASKSLYDSIANEFKRHLQTSRSDSRTIATNILQFSPLQLGEVNEIFGRCMQDLRDLSAKAVEVDGHLYQILITAFNLGEKIRENKMKGSGVEE